MVRYSGLLRASAVMALSMVLSAGVTAQTTTSPGASSTAAGTSISPTATTHFILPTPGPAPPGGASGNQTLGSCPGPLIPNTLGLDIPTCIGSCCIKCPAIESLYEPNRVYKVIEASFVTRQISLACSAFMALSYLVLPGKRAQPHISVLFLTMSLSLWYAAFDVMPGVSNACANDFEMSTWSNSRLCGAQGVLIIYLTQTSALWCSLLIYKLHLLAVWRSNWIDAYYGWFTGFCWIFPLAFAIPVAVKNLSQYPGIGFSCLVSTENLNTYLFYPTAVYIFPAFAAHIFTVIKMIHLAVMSSKIDTGLSQLSTDARMKITTTMQAKRLLRSQWRPALMVGTVMVTLTVFWLFYFVDAHRLASMGPSSPWMQEWMLCVMTNGQQGKTSDETQTICAKGIASHMPSIPWFTAAEMLMAILGIIVALVFISKTEFWEEWAYLLSNLLSRGKTGNGNGSLRGRKSPDEGSNSATAVTRSQGMDNGMKMMRSQGPNNGNNMNMAPGAFMNNNANSSSAKNTHGAPGTQWYDMDDLLDKEYDEHGNRRMNRSMSYGSQTGIATNTSPNPVSDPPRFTDSNTTGDLLYRPPEYEAAPTHWSPSPFTLATPSNAYTGQNNHERYVEQPVVPSPVPRTPKLTSPQVHLSNPIGSSSPPQSPTSPTGYHYSGSLSPMPPRSPTQRSRPLESIPIISVATRGSPAQAYQQQKHPSSPTSPGPQRKQQQQRVAKNQYNSNESYEQIGVASRESMARAGSEIGTSPNIRVNTNMDQLARSPPAPSVPSKNPHRQNHPGYMSPTAQAHASPSSPSTSHSYR
ncbi:hypothetical protein BG011_004431 [Mortierella polycephala]|uniref:G-protein coupled receptors family 2 profile 2 domain-containing protein n=1 Tax=Mortierella polycephala TaxID=41804 RepID=A0A9P6Q057_9FUNG|nr:hypothetical protein BG011_004431 [Mortierella polycephala]